MPRPMRRLSVRVFSVGAAGGGDGSIACHFTACFGSVASCCWPRSTYNLILGGKAAGRCVSTTVNVGLVENRTREGTHRFYRFRTPLRGRTHRFYWVQQQLDATKIQNHPKMRVRTQIFATRAEVFARAHGA